MVAAGTALQNHGPPRTLARDEPQRILASAQRFALEQHVVIEPDARR